MASLAVVPLTLLATEVAASASPQPSPRPDAPAFSLSSVRGHELKDVSGFAPSSATGRLLDTQGFSVLRASSDRTAVVDRSMTDQGITTATGTSSVDISWKGYDRQARYVVNRDGEDIASLGAGVTSFHDTGLRAGSHHSYRVTPILPKGGNPHSRVWGVQVDVPTVRKGENELSALRREAVRKATAAAVARTTTVSWMTFIPQKKINAPLAGCDYGRNFQFGGDGHGYDWKSSKYRTSLNAVITWSGKKVDGYKDIGASHVYVKSTGRLVATKTASDRDMKAKKMGSGGNYVDIRLVTHATNPFCHGLGGVKGAIDGAISMHVTTGGNWSIISGKHRLMPNHLIYIYNGGRVTTVYKRSYANEACLIGSAACPEADLTGYYGKFN
ncbi:hypothetical protein GCM10010503_64670 [Streptomyces lucensis JCM 4490]|uniref:Uncharacterized protein n=1 Tax=Streptomyces lucensis JCM 4490 TaxID=1306176 RepID=A0A918JGE8_9ACTN|nr:hypothetical protein [Streptomyces lucensis]GGW77905.1 hypothetical protein GCM10010503_64670 [Streptomyces lucensis JCM 4490]